MVYRVFLKDMIMCMHLFSPVYHVVKHHNQNVCLSVKISNHLVGVVNEISTFYKTTSSSMATNYIGSLITCLLHAAHWSLQLWEGRTDCFTQSTEEVLWCWIFIIYCDCTLSSQFIMQLWCSSRRSFSSLITHHSTVEWLYWIYCINSHAGWTCRTRNC